MYSIPRTTLATMIAGHMSGIEGADPEPDDYELANRLIAIVEAEANA